MQTNSVFRKNSFLALIAGCLFFISSCDRKFDSPPDFQNPNITATKTIAQIKALHKEGEVEALPDEIIEGVVVADDKSGNYYKQISIQDATAGITLRLDGTNLYANYPVGRKIYIKTKGLFMGDYAGLVQVGGSINDTDPTALNVNALASTLFDTYIIKGSLNNAITPKVVTVAELNDALQSMLIEIDNAEVIAADTSKTYANATTQTSANINIKTCAGESIIVRSSGFAKFAGINVPNGNGKLLAIYTRFRTTKQLIIRDTSDVQFTNARCGGVTPGPGTDISIAQLRALYTGSDLKLDKNYTIHGVVIADIANKNISNGNVIIQDGNAGIAVYLGGTLTYSLGDSVVFNLTTADSLIKFSGSLEVKTAFGTTAPTPVATGKSVTPKVITISALNAGLSAALGSPLNPEFTLVKLVGATAPAGKYSGSQTLTDATGTITMFTRAAATFSGATMPTGAQDWIGYGSMFNTTKQFLIRNTSDVTGSSGGGGGGGGATGSLINIADVRALFTGTTTTIPADKKITGVVISDKVGANITTKNIVIQQGEGKSGIVVRFTADNTFDLGDSIEIGISGMELSEFNGLLQLNNVPNANAVKIESGKSIQPRTATVEQVISNFEAWESTLVKLTSVTLTGTEPTWKGTSTVTQSGKTIAHFTTSYAAFASATRPTGSVNMTAIVSQGGTTKAQQVSIRNAADVQ